MMHMWVAAYVFVPWAVCWKIHDQRYVVGLHVMFILFAVSFDVFQGFHNKLFGKNTNKTSKIQNSSTSSDCCENQII